MRHIAANYLFFVIHFEMIENMYCRANVFERKYYLCQIKPIHKEL